ncbi:6-phospho-beta-glucosidase [Quadrisphaera granulorum]|uniref:6-phospho-beta-glucosidase n=1 Tax=Quadrisphaera granulorum TaxID=317664 RepID=A0A315ZPN7_9ACTN|nr:glycoside hydrolase [Quadrisphaera granulorum]PWJ47595.1 6-phospho-beta-glucosidase [Quadrisphaera granulorum]SZE98725.1 6-phospho-beta-glucosidase [Quadrisphaera granulorum]
MASIKLVYIGGGSSRGAGTMASLLAHGKEFEGSEVVIQDADPTHLEAVETISRKLAAAQGLDITISSTTDRRAALTDADAVLSSFRPGGFEARALDERIPLKHGVIGQETQGPGGFFMALRSIAVYQDLLRDLDDVAPGATIFNYTNPVNIVSQAVSLYSDRTIWSMCEGPITFPLTVLHAAGLDPARAEVTMAGVNHNCWSTEHLYDGEDLMPLLDAAWEARRDDPSLDVHSRRMLHLATAMRSVPSDYFQYYYFSEDVLRDLRGRPTTRAEDLLTALPGYWEHYDEQVRAEVPALDPSRSRGGIHELELAIDVMSAHFNDTGARLPVNLPNTGGFLPGFDDDVVVEAWCTVDAAGVHPLPQKPLPHSVKGLVQQLAEYQYLAAVAAWEGTRADGLRALAANPMVPTLAVAEELYDEMARAHRHYLPERLLA